MFENPPTRQMNQLKMFRKNLFPTNYFLIFPSKVQNLTVFSTIFMIRIRIFGPRESIQTGFRAAQYEPNAPIEVSSEATPIVLLSSGCSPESNADGLATTLDAFEAGDRSDLGRLAHNSFFRRERQMQIHSVHPSPPRVQDREIEARCESAFKHREIDDAKSQKQKNQVETQVACTVPKWNLSEQRDLRNFLERKPDQAFQGECVAQTKLSEAQSELDRREWKMQNADRALYETGSQLQSQRMELYQANQ